MSKKKIKSKNSVPLIKKVLLKGPILTNSGYGVHTRQLFESLKCIENIDLYIQPTQWGNTSWILSDDNSDANVSEIVSYCKKVNDSRLFDVSYQVLLPNEWKKLASKNVGITAGFEADIVKRSWLDNCNEMDLVIVPSIFSKSAFIKTSKMNDITLDTEIKVVNEWYYRDFDDHDYSFDYDLDFIDDIKSDKNILIIGQITNSNETSDRKNMFKTIRCACEFIRERKDVGIVLKINAGRYTTSALNNLKNRLDIVLDGINKDRVCLVSGLLNTRELKGLYESKKISCLLSGTRGEGWGLPFIEAASCGLPIIATDFSAYKEFLDDDFLKIDYEKEIISYNKEFIDIDANPYWANFKKESMNKGLTSLFDNIDYYEKAANERKNIIKQKYNSANIIKYYKKIFESNF